MIVSERKRGPRSATYIYLLLEALQNDMLIHQSATGARYSRVHSMMGPDVSHCGALGTFDNSTEGEPVQ